MELSFEQLSRLLRSRIKALEVMCVIKEIKPTARILCREEDVSSVKKSLSRSAPHVVESSFKLLKSPSSGLYSDHSVKIGRSDQRNGYVVLYISKGKNQAESSKALEEKGDHFELGLSLGYPKCCCGFFPQRFSRQNTDLTIDIFERSKGNQFPYFGNIAARHLDASLLFHFPCSFTCAESLKIAKNHGEILGKSQEEAFQSFVHALKGPVLYTKNQGVHFLRNGQVKEDRIEFTHAISTEKGKLHYLLNEERQVEFKRKDHVRVGGIDLDPKVCALMIFS